MKAKKSKWINPLKCKECKKRFVPKWNNPHQRFCTLICRVKNGHKRERQARKIIRRKHKRTCQVCGKKFYGEKNNWTRQKFCKKCNYKNKYKRSYPYHKEYNRTYYREKYKPKPIIKPILSPDKEYKSLLRKINPRLLTKARHK